MSPATVTCPRCRGTGEVVARSRRVGGGCVNDDWDTCPQCHGNGYVKITTTTPQQALSEQQALEILEGFARRGDWQALLAKLKTRELIPTTEATS
ncbi:MAG: hypothetical protein WC972_02920 [Trueperaceae bacterium]